jgi:hypothetical protein
MSIIDFHVHTAPSLLPRHHDDREIGDRLAAAGVGKYVLKAHEGSTAERALLAGNGAIGSIVLNSPVGGANPDAVSVAAAFGARVVWMPTVSAQAHQAARSSPELVVHGGLNFRTVPVCVDGRITSDWRDVFDVVATNDMILASGHVAMDEAIVAFRAAHEQGVRRFLVTHPLMTFLGWRADHIEELVSLGAYLEVGVLADAHPDEKTATVQLASAYPSTLLVFGSDLGHAEHAAVEAGIRGWLETNEDELGGSTVDQITETNGRELLTR